MADDTKPTAKIAAGIETILGASWRPKAAAIGAALAFIFGWLNKRYQLDLPVDRDTLDVVAGGLLLLGMCFVRDNKVTSERAGADTSPPKA